MFAKLPLVTLFISNLTRLTAVVCMKVRFEAKVTRGFSLSSSRSRHVVAASRLAPDLFREEKSRKTSGTRVVDLLIHSEQYANTSMAVLIKRVTCKSSFFFFLGTKKSFKLQNLPSRTSTLFLSRRSACPFLNCDQVSNRFTEYSGKLKFYTLCSRKVRY